VIENETPRTVGENAFQVPLRFRAAPDELRDAPRRPMLGMLLND